VRSRLLKTLIVVAGFLTAACAARQESAIDVLAVESPPVEMICGNATLTPDQIAGKEELSQASIEGLGRLEQTYEGAVLVNGYRFRTVDESPSRIVLLGRHADGSYVDVTLERSGSTWTPTSFGQCVPTWDGHTVTPWSLAAGGVTPNVLDVETSNHCGFVEGASDVVAIATYTTDAVEVVLLQRTRRSGPDKQPFRDRHC
jgi:hypothetical protein